ncbi:hypothetical protein [Calothrix sp. UHCC 0171]|uniref:hypothetical protein n=1 Tax=Calothrix sp. UHCC 0171 TaxID=3110245 RepID=UPI002B1F83BC|nr:hypothetical protein [Calothrix sp. UHCC 0171]MEA5573732.1 hypothetical protein [Calothrix sp. UHCC 0171]
MLKKFCLLRFLLLPGYFIATIPVSAQVPKAPVVTDVTSLEKQQATTQNPNNSDSVKQRLLESKQQQNANAEKPQKLNPLETRWRKFKQELDILFGF